MYLSSVKLKLNLRVKVKPCKIIIKGQTKTYFRKKTCESEDKSERYELTHPNVSTPGESRAKLKGTDAY